MSLSKKTKHFFEVIIFLADQNDPCFTIDHWNNLLPIIDQLLIQAPETNLHSFLAKVKIFKDCPDGRW